MEGSIIRIANFNSAHRLFRKDWDDETNKKVFGLCSLPNFHGHNYKLEVKISGAIDEQTGFIIDIDKVKKMIDAEVMDCFDHKNLNLDTPEFSNLNPTVENIARVIYQKLRKHVDASKKLYITLHETERNIAQYGDL